jgi:hypothetical protein
MERKARGECGSIAPLSHALPPHPRPPPSLLPSHLQPGTRCLMVRRLARLQLPDQRLALLGAGAALAHRLHQPPLEGRHVGVHLPGSCLQVGLAGGVLRGAGAEEQWRGGGEEDRREGLRKARGGP